MIISLCLFIVRAFSQNQTSCFVLMTSSTTTTTIKPNSAAVHHSRDLMFYTYFYFLFFLFFLFLFLSFFCLWSPRYEHSPCTSTFWCFFFSLINVFHDVVLFAVLILVTDVDSFFFSSCLLIFLSFKNTVLFLSFIIVFFLLTLFSITQPAD